MTLILILIQPLWLWIGWRVGQGKTPIPEITKPVRIVGGDDVDVAPTPVRHRL